MVLWGRSRGRGPSAEELPLGRDSSCRSCRRPLGQSPGSLVGCVHVVLIMVWAINGLEDLANIISKTQ